MISWSKASLPDNFRLFMNHLQQAGWRTAQPRASPRGTSRVRLRITQHPDDEPVPWLFSVSAQPSVLWVFSQFRKNPPNARLRDRTHSTQFTPSRTKPINRSSK
jgi:hypothetical protein